MILEREVELEALDAALASACAGTGSLLLIEGEAGLGKTCLLDELALRARAAGVKVLSARATPLEADFAYGVAGQLLEAEALAEPSLLDGPAAAAGQALGLTDAAIVSDTAGPATRHGLFRVVAALAATTRGLVIAVDDAQWADEASRQFLAHVANRVGSLPLLLAMTWRSGERDDELAELRLGPHMRTLQPQALSPEAARSLAVELIGAGTEERGNAMHELSGGNPFLLTELLLDATVEASSSSSVPGRVADSVRTRLTRLGRDATLVAEAAAVLAADAQVRRVAELAGLSSVDVAAAADSLTLARILTHGRPLSFVHPLVSAAVLGAVTPGRRDELHRRAAAALADEPGGADRAAAHLLATEPRDDDAVVTQLRAAATRALDRGAPATAQALLERARAEPCDDDGLHALLGRALKGTGHQRDAIAAFERALEGDPPADERLDITRELAGALATDERTADARALLIAAAETATDPTRRMQLEADAASVGLADDAHAAGAAERCAALARGVVPSSDEGRTILALDAYRRAFQCEGHSDEIAERIEELIASGWMKRTLFPETFVPLVVGFALLLCDRYEQARQHLGTLADEAEQRGAIALFVPAQAALSRALLASGDVDHASAVLARLSDVDLAAHHRIGRPAAVAATLGPQIERGELDRAERTLRENDCDATLPATNPASTLLTARLALRRAQGRVAEAVDDAEDLLRRVHQRGHPGLRMRTAAAAAFLAAGDHERARDLAQHDVTLARAFGAPTAEGAALRIVGLATDDCDILRDAVDVLAPTPARLEHARALVDYGAALRRDRHRQQARPLLAEGLDLATRCGSPVLAGRARDELHACGARPRRELLSGVASLTASERRIADLAAAGRSNPEIAAELFVTRHTVESHLTQIYRKLDISSRSALPGALEKSLGSLRDANDGLSA